MPWGITGCYNGGFVLDFIASFLSAIRVFFRSRLDTSLEVLALRQQVAVLKRTVVQQLRGKSGSPLFTSLEWTVVLGNSSSARLGRRERRTAQWKGCKAPMLIVKKGRRMRSDVRRDVASGEP